MKYLCILDQIEEINNFQEKKNENEKLFKKEYLYVSKDKTKNLDILNSIENYYFKNN